MIIMQNRLHVLKIYFWGFFLDLFFFVFKQVGHIANSSVTDGVIA